MVKCRLWSTIVMRSAKLRNSLQFPFTLTSECKVICFWLSCCAISLKIWLFSSSRCLTSCSRCLSSSSRCLSSSSLFSFNLFICSLTGNSENGKLSLLVPAYWMLNRLLKKIVDNRGPLCFQSETYFCENIDCHLKTKDIIPSPSWFDESNKWQGWQSCLFCENQGKNELKMLQFCWG